MKILHTSDIHLESSLTRLPKDKVRERKGELFATFERMVDEAARLEVNLFIIAGDLFDTERISKKACEKVTNIIEKNPGIEFLYLPGNHERGGFIGRVSALPKNLKVFGNEWTYFEYGETVIAGRCECSADMFSTLTLDPGRKNLLVLHGEVKEHSVVGEGISLTDAAGRGIDYIALGHYHSYSARRIDKRGIAVYSGTPEGRGFDESGECGFVLIDIDSDELRHKFCPFAKRTVRIVHVDISEAERRLDIDEAVSDALEKVPYSDLVRVVIEGKRPLDLYADTDAILERYRTRFYYFDVRDESGIRIDPLQYAHDKSLKGEFIRLVYSRTDLTEHMKDRIIRCGLGALMGEETDI